jgi:hypothetical protein
MEFTCDLIDFKALENMDWKTRIEYLKTLEDTEETKKNNTKDERDWSRCWINILVLKAKIMNSTFHSCEEDWHCTETCSPEGCCSCCHIKRLYRYDGDLIGKKSCPTCATAGIQLFDHFFQSTSDTPVCVHCQVPHGKECECYDE